MAKLADNWKGLHKSSTVILSIIGILISLSDILLTNMGFIQAVIPQEYYGYTMFGLSVLIAVCRYIKQEALSAKIEEKTPPNSPQE